MPSPTAMPSRQRSWTRRKISSSGPLAAREQRAATECLTAQADRNGSGHPMISPDQGAGSDAGHQRRCQTDSDHQDAILVPMVQGVALHMSPNSRAEVGVDAPLTPVVLRPDSSTVARHLHGCSSRRHHMSVPTYRRSHTAC